MQNIKHGDFTHLAKQYINRPGYSTTVINALMAFTGCYRKECVVADVGAGTGKLTEILAELGLGGFAVEPNDAMRNEAIHSGTSLGSFEWSRGFAEQTGIADSSVNWVFMASSFHWTDQKIALAEFHRILKGGGYFTALWNPRDIEKSAVLLEIEELIKFHVPHIKRVSSGSRNNLSGIEEVLLSTGHFHDVLFVEAPHEVYMSQERFLNAWRSVNDIQVQAGPDTFEKIMSNIKKIIEGMESIKVPYKTRSWTVRAT